MEKHVVPIVAVVKPTQFSSKGEQGKTNTSLHEMERMNKFYMNFGEEDDKRLELSLDKKKKKIIHIIITNNSLLETKQWNNKVASFGVNTMAIFSSVDVKTRGDISSLIHDGDDKGKKINYLMACANSTRIEDIKWLIRRYAQDHPDYMFNIFLDEFDKLPIYVQLINSIKTLKNIHMIYAISATPYYKWFKMLSTCGYEYIPIITHIENDSEYRKISDHRLIYSDETTKKDPAENFKYILENPGKTCYTSLDKKIIIKLPDLSKNTGKIIFVPAEHKIVTHLDVAKIALDSGKNVLILNGENKGFFLSENSDHDMEKIKLHSIESYKKEKIKTDSTFNSYDSPMTIARKMYQDKSLKLNEKDLVLTGFNCVERGVTFCLPGFQFHTAIFSSYHYTEGSKEKESIVQLAGRATGASENVAVMNIISPKYLIDEVAACQDNLINFLKTNPNILKYHDMMSDGNAIPIRMDIDEEIILQIENQTCKKKKSKIIYDGIISSKIRITDMNTYSNMTTAEFLKHMFKEYDLKTVRMVTAETNEKNYRLDTFSEANMKGRGAGQGNVEGSFCIDISCKNYVIREIEIKRGLGFITFKPKVILIE